MALLPGRPGKPAAAIIELAAELDAAAKGEAAGAKRRARCKAIPGFFVLTSARSADPLTDNENYAACCCAAQNLMLYLWRCGIGVKWTTGGVTRRSAFLRAAVDATRRAVVGFFFYGLPKVVPEQNAAASRTSSLFAIAAQASVE